MTFSGRRPTDRAKSFGRALLDGLDAITTVSHDAPKRARIVEIDRLLEDLQQERDHLIASLYEPGDLKVSENYNPRWTKKYEDVAPSYDISEGRLTQCKGRWSATSQFHDAHPGCPYINTKHNPHEFTLRD